MKHFSRLAIAAQNPDFADEAQKLRDRMSHLLDMIDRLPEPADVVDEAAHARTFTAQRVCAILKGRRLRDQSFEPGLFADPAWDILLELYAAELGDCRMAVSSLCIGAAVPATTALRWIRLLEQKGLVTRTPDATDGRRVFVCLSQKGSTAMSELMRRALPNDPLF